MRSLLILAYHSVSDTRDDGLAVRTADFRWQLEWLKAHGYQSSTVARYLAGGSDARRTVIITFDDGYLDNYTSAVPMLSDYGYVATVFVVSDMIGQSEPFWWDVPKIGPRAARAPEEFRAMSWAHLRELSQAGIEIGSHTCSHPDHFADLPTGVRRCELTRSKETIEDGLSRAVSSFSYPRGSVNEDTIRLVEQAGYAGGVVTPPRAGIPKGRYTLRRAGIYRNTARRTFKLKTKPLVRWVAEETKRFRAPIPAMPPASQEVRGPKDVR